MPKENQRVALSKRMLKDGLLKLLQKKHIDEISISELCALSQINRTTFYRHYQTPHDVLLEIEFDFIRTFYNDPAILKYSNDMKKHAVHMCAFLFENKDMVKLFIRNNTVNDITIIFKNFSEGFLSCKSVLYKGQQISNDTFRLMSTFFSHGVYALVRQWIIEDIPLTPDDVAELIIGSFNRDFAFR